MKQEEKELLVNYTLAKLAEAPTLVKNNIELDGKQLKFRRVYFRIKKYIDDFLFPLNTEKIEDRLLIMPGLRGVGKTTILFQLYDYLIKIKKIQQDRLLYLSVDELKQYLGKSILEAVTIFIEEIHRTTFVNLDKPVFIFVDEAHFDPDWSITAKLIFDKSKKVFLIFTGSSALGLELGVDTSRRARKEVIFPLNFSEYITLKYDVYPPKDMAPSLRNLIFKQLEQSLDFASEKESELTKKLLQINKPVDKEIEDFLCFRGFPFGLNLDQINIHQRIFDMLEKVIEKDVFSIKNFDTETRGTILKVLTFLALQTPGGTSDVKLAERLNTSPTQIRNILDTLERTYIIFSVKPYGGAGKTVKKPWKYYFLSPSINAAIRFKLGRYNINDREMIGILAENIVASYFFRMRETTNLPTGIFYDSNEEGVDFLIQFGENNLVPVEVGLGKKESSQIKKAINNYKSKYGIVISNTEKIRVEDNVIFIPIKTFLFV